MKDANRFVFLMTDKEANIEKERMHEEANSYPHC
jgi:hypothetical protein